MRGAGSTLWSRHPDQFHFVYQAVTGDCQIIARVDTLGARWAGVMFRETLRPDSEYALEALARSGEGLTYRSRRGPDSWVMSV